MNHSKTTAALAAFFSLFALTGASAAGTEMTSPTPAVPSSAARTSDTAVLAANQTTAAPTTVEVSPLKAAAEKPAAAADVKSVEAESVRSESADAKPADTDAANAESAEAKSTDVEAADVKAAAAKSADAEAETSAAPAAKTALPAGSEATGFTDVPPDYWAAKSIRVMTSQGYISGYSNKTFKPEQPMTREEAAALFDRLIGGTPPVILAMSFTDITSDRWSATAIEAVARKNIISGYGDKTYRPNQKMSRQEFAVVADNYLHYLGYQLDDPTKLEDIAYRDQKFTAPWAQDAVRELAYLGILSYDPNHLFNPEKYITRAEATEIIYRMTSSQEAVALRNTIQRAKVEKKVDFLLDRTFGSQADFYKLGLTYWQDNKLHIAIKDKKQLTKAEKSFASVKDSDLANYTVLQSASMTQADFDLIQTEATNIYKTDEPRGTILSVQPDPDHNSLIMNVTSASALTRRELNKKLGKKLTLNVLTPGSYAPVNRPGTFTAVKIVRK